MGDILLSLFGDPLTTTVVILAGAVIAWRVIATVERLLRSINSSTPTDPPGDQQQ